LVGVAVTVVVAVAVAVALKVAVGVGVAVPVGVEVAVGVGVVPSALVSMTACAVIATVFELRAVAEKVGEPIPANGAARSANASVKPSLVEAWLNPLLRALAIVRLGAACACPP
jgi:hypothetical protein